MRFVRITILSILLTPTLFTYVGVSEVMAGIQLGGSQDSDLSAVCLNSDYSEAVNKISGKECNNSFDKYPNQRNIKGLNSNYTHICRYESDSGDNFYIFGITVNGGCDSVGGAGDRIPIIKASKDQPQNNNDEFSTTEICIKTDKTTTYFKPKAGCSTGYTLVDVRSLANIKVGSVICYKPASTVVLSVSQKCNDEYTLMKIQEQPITQPEPGPGSQNKNNDKVGSTQVECPGDFVPKGPLCVPKNPFEGKGGIAGSNTLTDLIVTVIKSLLWAAGIIAVLMVIFGGYQWMTASSNETQRTNGRKTLTNALIGLVLVMLAYGIISLVTNVITKGL